MRILLVNDYATATAGAERVTLDLRNALRHRGHHVRVFASRAQLIPGASFGDTTCFGTNSRVQTLSSTVNLSARVALGRELRTFAPDVVQVQMFLWQLSPSILPLLREFVSIYYVQTFKAVCPTGLKWLPRGALCQHRAGAACIREGCLNATGFGPLMLQRYLWRNGRGAFNAVVPCSEAVRVALEADGIATREVIWPGCASVAPRPPLGQPPTVTYAGRLTPEKGVDILLRAFRQVHERFPEARLVIAGTGPQQAALGAMVADSDLAAVVKFTGQLGGDRLAAVLDRAWVHVVPSRWPEPFGLTGAEAMMRGTAVIASEVGGLAEIVEHEVTGLHVAPGDVSALADALMRVLADQRLAERMGAAGRDRAQRVLSLDRFASAFEALYESLLRRQPLAGHAG